MFALLAVAFPLGIFLLLFKIELFGSGSCSACFLDLSLTILSGMSFGPA